MTSTMAVADVEAKEVAQAQDLTYSFSVEQTPEDVFAAINNVRGWWSGEIEGETDKLGDVWTYRYKDIHYSKQRITELVPGRRVVWQVVDSYLSFVDDKTEWNGTRVVFEIARKGGKTEVRFTHAGLAAEHECFDKCSNAWGFYINGSLQGLIATGKGEPNRREQ